MILLWLSLLVLLVVLLAPRMANPLPSCFDRDFIVIVDPTTGAPVAVSAGGAITVTGTFTETAQPITESINTQVPIAGDTQIVAANANRKRLLLVNMDLVETVFLNFGAAATTGMFPLYPRTYFDSDNGAWPVQQEVRGIEGAGAPLIAVVEFI